MYLSGAAAIVRRDISVFLTYRAQVVSIAVSTLTSVALFYYISRLVNVTEFTPSEYFAFAVVGLAISNTLATSFELSSSVRGELLTGTLERLVVSPFGIIASVVSMVLFPMLLAFGIAAATLALGVIFGISLQWSTAVLTIPVMLLGSLSFIAVGLLFAALTVVFKQGAVGVGLAATAIGLVSGVYFPVTLLPQWLEWISYAQPFTPALDLTRHVLVGTPLRGGPWTEVAKLVGFAVVLLPLAVLALKRAVGRARRTGTITEY